MGIGRTILMASTATKMATGQMVDHSGHGQRNHSCERDRERIKLDTIRLNDNYEVEELFIKSANAILYKGRCLRTKQKVILKQMPKRKNVTLRKVADRMVPPEVYYHLSAYDTPESRIIKLLEYFENSIDLFELIKRKGPLNEEIVKVIFAQILFMWESLNRAGICHRDIKDENIIINLDTLQCSLIDFGCATEMTNQSTSIFCGTLEFYPPEYYQTGYYNQSDLTSWSVGLVLYLLLIGHLPFNSVDDLLNFDIETNSGISDLKNAHISPDAFLLLEKLLARDPLQRANLETAKHFGLAFLNH